MRKASLGSERIGVLIENLPQMFQLLSEQVQSLSTLISACFDEILDDDELRCRMDIIDELYSCAEDIDDIAVKFADAITDRVYEYETKTLVIPNVSPSEALSALMDDRGLKQSDLKSVASQSIVSDIVNGKRTMNLEQVKGFSSFFNVPVETFMGHKKNHREYGGFFKETEVVLCLPSVTGLEERSNQIWSFYSSYSCRLYQYFFL